jgi:hypothetical protein
MGIMDWVVKKASKALFGIDLPSQDESFQRALGVWCDKNSIRVLGLDSYRKERTETNPHLFYRTSIGSAYYRGHGCGVLLRYNEDLGSIQGCIVDESLAKIHKNFVSQYSPKYDHHTLYSNLADRMQSTDDELVQSWEYQ